MRSSQQSGNGKPPFWRSKKILLAGFVVVAALGVLIYVGLSQFSTYYYTLSEFQEKGDSLYGKDIRLAGQVVPESISWDTGNVSLSFTIADGNATLPVMYRGIVPDAFKAGQGIIVEGKYDGQGVFSASKLITKCPSKYEPSQ